MYRMDGEFPGGYGGPRRPTGWERIQAMAWFAGGVALVILFGLAVVWGITR